MPRINQTDISDIRVGESYASALIKNDQVIWSRYQYVDFNPQSGTQRYEMPEWADGFVAFLQGGGGGGDNGDGGVNAPGWGGGAGACTIVESIDWARIYPNKRPTHISVACGLGGARGTDRGGGRAKPGKPSTLFLGVLKETGLPGETHTWTTFDSWTVSGGEQHSAGNRNGVSAPQYPLSSREKTTMRTTSDYYGTGGLGGGRAGNGEGAKGGRGAGGGGGDGGFFGAHKWGGAGGDGMVRVWFYGYYPPYKSEKVARTAGSNGASYSIEPPSWARFCGYALFAGGAGGVGASSTQIGLGGDSGSTALGYKSWNAGEFNRVNLTIGRGGAGGTATEAPTSGGNTSIAFGTGPVAQAVNGAVAHNNRSTSPSAGFGNGYNSIDISWARVSKEAIGSSFRPCIGGVAGTASSPNGKVGENGGGGGGGLLVGSTQGTGGTGAPGYAVLWFWEAAPWS